MTEEKQICEESSLRRQRCLPESKPGDTNREKYKKSVQTRELGLCLEHVLDPVT